MTPGRHSPRSGRLALVMGISLLAVTARVTRGSAQTAPDPMSPLLRAIVEAEEALQQDEPQIAESRYRTALLEGWLLLGALAVAENDLEAAQGAYETATTAAVETRRALLSLAAIHLRTGDPGDTMYVVNAGEIDIEIDGKVVETLSGGTIFGEMALIDGSARSARREPRHSVRFHP